MDGNTHSHGPRAFTLIELLVVLGIVAALAALITPVANGVLNDAKVSASASNLRQIGTAALLYAAENNNTFPPHAIFDPELGQNREWCFGYFQFGATNPFEHGILAPYMQDHEETLTCPVWQATDDFVVTQMRAIGKPSGLGYGYNGLNLSEPVPPENSPGGQQGHYKGRPLHIADNPRETVMFATSAQPFGEVGGPQEMIWGPDHVIAEPCVRLVTDSEAVVCWADGSVSMANAIPVRTLSDGVTLGRLDIDKDGTADPDQDIWIP